MPQAPARCAARSSRRSSSSAATRSTRSRRIKAFARVRGRGARGARSCTADAREARLRGGRSTAIVTSPPYPGLIDYHEQHRYAYELLGLDDRRELEIGAAARRDVAGVRSRRTREGSPPCSRTPCRALRARRAGARRRQRPPRPLSGDPRSRRSRLEQRLRRHVNRRTGRRAGEFYEDVLVARRLTGPGGHVRRAAAPPPWVGPLPSALAIDATREPVTARWRLRLGRRALARREQVGAKGPGTGHDSGRSVGACSPARSPMRSSASTPVASRSRRTSSTASPPSRSSGSPTAPARRRRSACAAGSSSAELEWPGGAITVNLAPAELRKEGSGFDLPIALAVLAASRQVPPPRSKGTPRSASSPSTDGSGRCGGVLAAAEGARRTGSSGCSARPSRPPRPRSPGSSRCRSRHLAEAAAYLRGEREPAGCEPPTRPRAAPPPRRPRGRPRAGAGAPGARARRRRRSQPAARRPARHRQDDARAAAARAPAAARRRGRARGDADPLRRGPRSGRAPAGRATRRSARRTTARRRRRSSAAARAAPRRGEPRPPGRACCSTSSPEFAAPVARGAAAAARGRVRLASRAPRAARLPGALPARRRR